MSDTEQAEAIALAEIMEGYSPKSPAKQARGDEAQETGEIPAIKEPPAITVTDLADELKALKARIIETQGDANEVRRLNGAVGDINRSLKAMQTPPAPAPDEGDAALDEAANEYPDLAGPMVKEIKALKARLFQQQSPEDRRAERYAERQQERQEDAIESLKDEHPDFMIVRDTPEYKTWLSSKPSEFQEKFTSSWNPAVVARGLNDFKDSLKVREVKQSRLAGAITPQGVPQKVGQSTLSDDEALWVGYNKGHKRFK